MWSLAELGVVTDLFNDCLLVCFEVAKRCYEFMNACETQDIYRELKANDLNEWIWTGAGGFSSIHSIFIINEKDHPLCSHVAVVPYELYEFEKFFERLGVKRKPDPKQLEHILVKCVKTTQKLIQSSPTRPLSVEHSTSVLENAAKNYPLVNWIKTYHGGDKKLALIIKDYEESLAAVGSLSPFVNGSPYSSPSSSSKNGATTTNSSPMSSASSPSDSPSKLDSFDTNTDSIYLYLPELYKSVEIKDNLISSVATLVKNRPIKILDEEAYLMRKVGFIVVYIALK